MLDEGRITIQEDGRSEARLLRDYYSGLKPGKYHQTVKRRSSGKDFSLASNTIEITIEGEKE